MNDVKKAGKVIAVRPKGQIIPLDENVIRAFKVANNWRDAHAYPMRSIRAQTALYIRRLDIDGFAAARLKRMQAIRRKLSRIGPGLNQLQDLAGCRAIVSSVGDAHKLADILTNRSRHHCHNENDYISHPKPRDGYRSRHIIFEFRGEGDAAVHSGRRVELQIRTRIQHSWATAVEAVGLFRGEDLKGNKGDENWLRLFKLISAEFARFEDCSEPDGVPNHRERLQEIDHLNRLLSASQTLENISHSVVWASDAIQVGEDRPQYYMLTYDNETAEVRVRAYFNSSSATVGYDDAERRDNEDGTNRKNVVLVEAGRINQMKDAYPNYFGDVQYFRQNLQRLCLGMDAIDFTLVKQERIAQRKERAIDLGWLRYRGRMT